MEEENSGMGKRETAELLQAIQEMVNTTNTQQQRRRRSDYNGEDEKKQTGINWVQLLVALLLPFGTGAVGVFSIYNDISKTLVEINKDIEQIQTRIKREEEYFADHIKSKENVLNKIRVIESDLSSIIQSNLIGHKTMSSKISALEDALKRIEEEHDGHRHPELRYKKEKK